MLLTLTAHWYPTHKTDLELFDIKAKLNSVCEDIELLKLNFESFKRSTDLSTKSGPIEALERENSALKAKLKEVEAERDSLELTFLAKDLNAFDLQSKFNRKKRSKGATNYGRGPLRAGRGEKEKERTRFAFERKCREEYQKDAINGHS